MISPHPLDRLVQRDTLGQALALMTPKELVVAVLRLEGLSDAQIAALLDINRSRVHRRMEQARKRIMRRLPELAPLLRDREQDPHRPCNEMPPLEHGWICHWGGAGAQALPDLGADLTVRDVTRCYGVVPQTVTRWIRQGCFPHAYRVGGQRGDYRIPKSDLVGFEPDHQRSTTTNAE